MASDATSLLNRAQVLLGNGQPDAAFLLLDEAEAESANNLSFSYLHGLAALESSRPGIAVLSFQRAIRIQPDFAGARLELGRAYYANGETDLSQREFEQLLLLKPPPEAVRVIERYLVAGEQRQVRNVASLNLTLGAVVGFNSNANSGLSRETLFGITLDEQSRETSSSYTGGQLGVDGKLPIGDHWELAAGVDGSTRRYDDTSEVDSDSYGGQLALSYGSGSYRITSQFGGEQRDIGAGIDYRNLRTGLSVLKQLGESWLLSSSYSYGQLRFSEALENRDVNSREANLGLYRFFNHGWLKTVGAVALLGRDKRPAAEADIGEDWSRKLLGGRLSMDAELSARWGLALSYINLGIDYDEPFLAFDGGNREDRLQLVNATFTREQLLCEQCSFQLTLGYTDQHSNNPRFNFDGSNIGIGLERSF